ncbi:MAG: MBL fold metallo-hydrolase [Elusimicrobiales bacterium]|jgi:metallo-beta-lactamase family protein|nr:MBL fold metallo-hydrolase [Elusimicrobiales bacterium]NLH39465.1 MBL fold metallo-hydrolase [Elusimicrobiota bacterium]
MIIKFCGAAGGEVTGSKHLIKTDKGNILFDCGLFQGRRAESVQKNLNFLFTPDEVDAVVISHAHIDHIGVLPVLVKNGYKKDIYLTDVTDELSRIMLLDSARLQVEDAKFFNKIHQKDGLVIEPLYDEDDATKAFGFFKKVKRYESFYPVESVEVKFFNAGHVLGSSTVSIKIDGTKILYTGDIGRRNQLILKRPEFDKDVDYLIIETTYGDREHTDVSGVKEVFADIINKAVKNKGKIIIPSFSLERTQEIIYLLDSLRHEKDVFPIPVYVDSPMSVRVTNIFNKHIEEVDFNNDFTTYSRDDKDPFGYEYIKYISNKEESQALNDMSGPMIIISASGMCEGGRILHHLRNSIDDDRNIVLLVGYMAENTLGRRLKDGAKKVKIFGLEHEVYSEVRSMDFFSAHAGQSDLIEYVKEINPKKGILLVHGENKSRAGFKKVLMDNGFKNIFMPDYGEEVEI